MSTVDDIAALWKKVHHLREDVNRALGQLQLNYSSNTWAPAWTNLTITGAPTYTGKYWIVGKLIHVRILITPNGGTTASTATSTYCNNLPFTAIADEVALETHTDLSNDGPGLVVNTTTRLYTPTWAASALNRTINAWYEIA